MENKKVIIIGGGPGGYVAAIRLTQLGAHAIVVEKDKLGGTCLNVGCIPTKVLLHTAEIYEDILNSSLYGINVDGDISIDWDGLQNRKNNITAHLVGGVEGLLRLNNVEVINGEASFVDKNTISVKKSDGTVENLNADNFIIATGSESIVPPIKGAELNGVLNSTEILSLEEIPEELVVIGGGVIGVEFASLFNTLGTKVKLVEMLPNILPPIDREISEIVKMKLESNDVEVYTSSQVTEIKESNGKLQTIVKTDNGEIELQGDKVLISVGRKPVLNGLNLENIGVNIDKKGIKVNEKMETNIGGIYAIGDVVGINMLAHVASEQGVIAAENIMGIKKEIDYKVVPSCVYTRPEIASVGLTEEETKKQGLDYNTGVFHLANNSKTVIMNEFEGTLIKIISNKKYDEILGVHIYGPRATDLITEAALAIRLEATLDELITTIHAHPTIGEAMKEAALDVRNIAIHAAP